jgi:surface protein
MFKDCNNLKNLDISTFNTSQVNTMQEMFCNCTSLRELNLDSFDTSKVTHMSLMFWGDEALEHLDLTSFNTDSLEYTYEMLQYTNLLEDNRVQLNRDLAQKILNNIQNE